MSLELARANMVEQQIRTWDVLDSGVLDVIRELPREAFVPEAFRRLAYADVSVPLGEGQVMLPPRVEARIAQSLQIEPDDAVLEIGTGSGFMAAILSRLARHVTTVEIFPALAQSATAVLHEQGIRNVTVFEGDGLHGWDAHAPYEAIAITGSVASIDDGVLGQLAIGGRLFAVVGQEPAMSALLVTRTGERQWATESLFETVVPALVGVAHPSRFEL